MKVLTHAARCAEHGVGVCAVLKRVFLKALLLGAHKRASSGNTPLSAITWVRNSSIRGLVKEEERGKKNFFLMQRRSWRMKEGYGVRSDVTQRGGELKNAHQQGGCGQLL